MTIQESTWLFDKLAISTLVVKLANVLVGLGPIDKLLAIGGWIKLTY